MLKRIIALSLGICIIIFSSTLFSSAANVAGGKCGKDVYWSLDGNGVLTFSGEGVVYNYDSVFGQPWYGQRTNIRSMVFEEGITHIGNHIAFCCTELREVYIPSTVESIGEWAFGICISLEKFTVDPNNPYYTADENGVLFNRNVSELIIFPGGFSGEYTVPESVTYINDAAFYYCMNLTHITIPDSVVFIGSNCFSWCKSLKSADLPADLKYIGYNCFSFCVSLETVQLPMGIKAIKDDAFSHCMALEEIVIPDSVKSIGDRAFTYCTSLKSIDIPLGVNSVGQEAFSWCSSLEKTTIAESVEHIGNGAFYRCVSLESVQLPSELERISERCFGWCSSLRNISIPESVVEIGKNAFYESGIDSEAEAVSACLNVKSLVTSFIKDDLYNVAYDINGDGRINARDKAIA